MWVDEGKDLGSFKPASITGLIDSFAHVAFGVRNCGGIRHCHTVHALQIVDPADGEVRSGLSDRSDARQGLDIRPVGD